MKILKFLVIPLSLIILCLIAYYSTVYLLEIGIKRGYQDCGPIGDTFGGTMGPVIALIASFLTFLAFWVQYTANQQQKEYIKQQRFEDTFFRLLENYQRIVESMDLHNRVDFDSDVSIPIATGRDCFKRIHEAFTGTYTP